MNVLYCGDGNIADGVIISVLSLLKNSEETLNVYLLTADVGCGSTHYKALPKQFAIFLDVLVKKYNPLNTVKLYDISDKFSAEAPISNLATRFTPCCMLRLYADLVEGLPSKILYLDNDVICRLNPATFYNINMNDAEVAGVLDYYGSWLFKHNFLRRDYLNSGVLLLDLDKIKVE